MVSFRDIDPEIFDLDKICSLMASNLKENLGLMYSTDLDSEEEIEAPPSQ